MIRIVITETGRGHLKDMSRIFNEEIKEFKEILQVKDFLIGRYGRVPNMRNKVYVDTKDGQAKERGFTYSFWNKDWSHNSKKWFQTDWITFETIEIKDFALAQLR